MRTLVAYYSRSGNTRRVAEAIATALGADLEPIVDRADRGGILGYLRAGRDAYRRRTTRIDPPRLDPTGYDLVVVGTPVWASSVTPAVRTWLAEYRGRVPNVALFLTHGGSGRERVFAQMTELCGHFPLAALGLRVDELRSGVWESRVRDFAAEIAGLVTRSGTAEAGAGATG